MQELKSPEGDGLAAELGVVTALPCSQVGFLGAPSERRRWGVCRLAASAVPWAMCTIAGSLGACTAFAVLSVCGGQQEQNKNKNYTVYVQYIQ